MNRFLGGLFESIHVLAIALLFAAATWMTLATSPSFADTVGLTGETAARLFDPVAAVVAKCGALLAVAALAAAILAPYLRADANKFLAWGRVALVGVTLILVLWGWDVPEPGKVLDADVEMNPTLGSALAARANDAVTPWSALLLATAANLGLASFQIFSRAKTKKS